MFKPVDNGSTENVQGLICNIPPIGYVYNNLTGKVEKRGVYSRSPKKLEQYWEPTQLPKDYKKKREKEIKRQAEEEEFFDTELEQFRQQEWDRRLNGFWFK